MDIRSYLTLERSHNLPIVEAFLDKIIDRYQTFTPQYAELLKMLKQYLTRGGKWHRPALAKLGYFIAGGNPEATIHSSFAALELIHRYLLIHDDIIDQDYERHNGPTIERIYRDYFIKTYPTRIDEMYSRGMSIVAGDVVNSLAYELLTESAVTPEIIVAAMRAFNHLMLETAAGWQTQTEQNFMSLSDVSKDMIITGMTLVSAQYSVVWPLRFGQVLAGKLKSESWDVHLDLYGLNAGLAFQISDDILGMFGNPEETGKPVGHDYREGKKSILLYLAYSHASPAEKKLIDETLGTQIDESVLNQIKQIIESTGALRETQALADEYAGLAQEALKPISTIHGEEITLLRELADLFAHRTH